MSQPPLKISVVIADERPLFRGALANALDCHGCETRAVGDAASLADELAAGRVDVVVLDSRVEHGMEQCQAAREAGHNFRVLVVSDLPDDRLLLDAVEAGAEGYVARSMPLAQLVDAVRRVHAGEACIPPGMLAVLLRRLIDHRREQDEIAKRFSRLSRREKEVFALLVEGHDHRAIAGALVMSPHTARTHIQNVLEKLEVHSRLEAAALELEHKLLHRVTAEGGLGR